LYLPQRRTADSRGGVDTFTTRMLQEERLSFSEPTWACGAVGSAHDWQS
jgi:hypothetical protein